MKIRLGIIGAGFGEKVHVEAFRRNALCEVVAIAASSGAKAEAAAGRQKIPKYFGDWKKLIGDSAVDAVSIAVPPYAQPEMALAALEAKKPVFCEKPLSIFVREAEALAAKAQGARVANMVDFEFPEIPAWQKAREILGKGTIGALRHASVQWNLESYAVREGVDSWKTRSEKGGGALYAFVSHTFYYVEWLLGRIRRISPSFFKRAGAPASGETLVNLVLELESGALVLVSMSTHSFLGSGHRLEFYGSEGTLILENPTPDYIRGFQVKLGTRKTAKFEEVKVVEMAREGEDGRISAVSSLAGRFLKWIQTGEPEAPTFEHGLRVQRLIELARVSAGPASA